jgi:hypothetical protein
MNLLDTDHCIAILRKQLDLRKHAAPDEELATTVHGFHASLRTGTPIV